MTTTAHRRMSATERLEQLRDFVATHERPPSRRIGDLEEKSLGEWIAKHKNASTRTGEAVRELLAGGVLAAPAVNDLEDFQKFCAKHMRAPMAATGVAREQALWEWARVQTDPQTVAAITEARARCRVSTPGASQREKLGELAQFAKVNRRPPSPQSADKHERGLAEWVRINVQAKSYLAREVEHIYREYRADQHHAQRIAAGRLNGLVAFVAQTGRAPRAESSMHFLGLGEGADCVLHPGEAEAFRRNVVAHCRVRSEALGRVAGIWMEMISGGAPSSETVAALCQRLPELSPAVARRSVHRIRAVAVDMLESQLGITPADV